MSADVDALRVVLLSPRNPLNIGAAARAMSNFGCLHLRLVDAYDVAYKEAKSAVNASAVLAASEEFPAIDAAIADCALVVGTASPGHRVMDVPLHRLEYGSAIIRDQLPTGRVALLFGSEKFGMSNEEISRCQFLMQIPTRPEHESMNLGQAVAVCLYELVRDSAVTALEPVARPRAVNAELQRLTEMLIELARETGYVNQVTHESAELKIRRMVNRLDFSHEDCRMWLGMVRQALWRVRKDR